MEVKIEPALELAVHTWMSGASETTIKDFFQILQNQQFHRLLTEKDVDCVEVKNMVIALEKVKTNLLTIKKK